MAAGVAVMIGVAFSVLLMSVAHGVAGKIDALVGNPVLKQSHLLNASLITSILALLTVVVTSAMLAQTAAATFTLGVIVMRSRREEVAIRRQSGVLRSTLLREFLISMLWPCLLGGLAGEVAGLLTAFVLREVTVLPVRFSLVSVFAAFPVTLLLALLATLLPAWRSANASPAMLRKE